MSPYKMKLPPSKFANYELIEKIATGGMAELFKAKLTGAEGFEKLIAIKRILQHLNSEEKLVDSFISEAKLAANLHHPNIVQIYDFGNTEDTYYIAMEYLSGKDLRYTLKRVIDRHLAIDFELSLHIVGQVLCGLDYAHSQNDLYGNPLKIIHRDIGPQNIFMSFDGQVKIIDFGIAKAATQDTNTQVGTIKGKVQYMSPEQANGDAIDHRSDIFSTGAVLYELLTLKKMYEGDTFQVLAKARSVKFEPAENINGKLPKSVYAILKKALEKDPDARYQTAEAMLRDIDSFFASNSIRVYQKDLASFMKYLFDDERTEHQTRTLMKSEFPEIGDASTVITDENFKKTWTHHGQDNGRFNKRKMTVAAVIFSSVVIFIVSLGIVWKKHTLTHGTSGQLSVEINEDENKKDLMNALSAYEGKDYDKAIVLFEGILIKNPDAMDKIVFHYSKALTDRKSVV
jgi:serine/threonine protein kinase